MAFALISRLEDPHVWQQEFRRLLPDAKLRIWPDVGNASDVVMAAFDYDDIRKEVLGRLPNLKAVVFLGHGVNDLFASKLLPPTMPVIRLRDLGIIRTMVEYTILHVLKQHRFDATYARQQRDCIWERHQPRQTSSVKVGVMGLGSIGQAIAEAMRNLNFQVFGWARSKHSIDGVRCFHGRAQFETFLAELDYIICVLPLTSETEDLIDARALRSMKRGAYLINLGRGRLVVDQDLVGALNSGHLSGATLDVFRAEPLAKESPFWNHPKVIVTPHESGTQPEGSLPTIIENYRRLCNNEPLLNLADPSRGY